MVTTRFLVVNLLVNALLLSWCLAINGAATENAKKRCRSNPVVVENAKPGSPSTEWDINGAGDASIQGFATEISVNVGEPINFKVRTYSTKYRLDVYRMGYYNGTGARRQATLRPTVSLPQLQPACAYEASTHLVDCANWAVSASWRVPGTAVSGLYFARLVREDADPSSPLGIP